MTAHREWRTSAACRSHDPELFFPAADAGPVIAAQTARAKAVCAGCPVVGECLEFALSAIPYGVAGGLTADERCALRRTGSYTDSAGRLIGAGRDATAEVGRGQIAGGRRARVVEHEFGVSRRTAQRWAAQARAKEGSHGGNRAPLSSSAPTPSQGHQSQKEPDPR